MNNGWKRLLLVASYLMAVTGAGACFAEESDRSLTVSTVSALGEIPPAPVISLQQALTIAETAVGDNAYSAEREAENDQPIIEVEVANTEVIIDANNGDIIEIKNQLTSDDPEDIEDMTKALALQKLATITIHEALTVVEQSLNAKPHTVELKNRDGNLVYIVVIGLNKTYVDAGNGEILLTETATQNDSSVPMHSSIQVPIDPNDNGDDD